MSTFTPPEDFPHPHVSFRGEVGPDWLDANEHMNVSWYDRVFDEAEMRFFVEFGIEENSIRETGLTFFRLEKLVGYERENMSGDAIEVRSRVIWTDFRRVHHFHEMWNLTRQYRAAHVDAVEAPAHGGVGVIREAGEAILGGVADEQEAVGLRHDPREGVRHAAMVRRSIAAGKGRHRRPRNATQGRT